MLKVLGNKKRWVAWWHSTTLLPALNMQVRLLQNCLHFFIRTFCAGPFMTRRLQWRYGNMTRRQASLVQCFSKHGLCCSVPMAGGLWRKSDRPALLGSQLVAEVTLDEPEMRAALSSGFRQVAGFIFGKNKPAGGNSASETVVRARLGLRGRA